MAFSSEAVANYILKVAGEKSVRITPLKLQKLVYIAHGWYMGYSTPEGGHPRPLIDEQVEAWKYGPVIPTLYHTFKDYGRRLIDTPAKVMKMGESGTGNLNINIITPDIETENASEDELRLAKSIIKQVVDIYGSKSGVWLSNLTHQPGSPWHQTYHVDHHGNPPSGTDIDPDYILEHYRALISKQRTTKAE